MSLTIKGIEQVLFAYVESDPSIHGIRYADEWLANTKKDNGNYPLVLFDFVQTEINSNKTGQMYNTVDLMVACVDQVLEDRSNIDDVVSKTNTSLSYLALKLKGDSALRDLGVRFTEPNIKILRAQIQGHDRIDGCMVTMRFTLPLEVCQSELPFLPIAGISNQYSPSSTSSVFCAQLANCGLIQEIQTDIALLFTLTGGTGSFDCADLLGCSSFTDLSAQTQQNSADIIVLSARTSFDSLSANTIYSGSTNLQNIFAPIQHTHVSSAITDGSTGGNGTADSGKVAKYNTEGQLHGSSVNSVTAAVRGTASGSGTALEGVSLSGTGLYVQSTYGLGVVGVTSDHIAGRFFNNSSGSPAFEVYNLDPTNVGPIAHFHADDGLGMEVLNDGGLQWTSLTGAATTRTNLGLGSVLGDIVALSAATSGNTANFTNFLPLSGGTLTGLLDVESFTRTNDLRIDNIPSQAILYQSATSQQVSGNTARMRYDETSAITYIDSLSGRTFAAINSITVGGTNINSLYAPITRSVIPGTNISTGGTINSQIVGVIGSPVFTAVTAVNISATTFTESGTTLAEKYAPKNLTVTVTSGTYTLALTDNSRLVDMTGGTAQNLVVPPNSQIAMPIGAQVAVFQSGAGQVSFSAGTGVTIQSYQSHLKIAGQYGGASLVKRDTNVWALFGNLSA